MMLPRSRVLLSLVPATVLILPFLLAGASAPVPQITLFSPQGIAKDVRQVRVQFSEPMVPFGDPRGLQEPFQIRCEAEGKSRWADGRNWVYDFEGDLPGGVSCTFTLKDSVRTLSGKVLSGDRVYQFSTGGPSVRGNVPYQGATVSEDQVFVLYLDADPSRESIQKHAFFRVSEKSAAVPVEILPVSEQKAVLAKVETPWSLRETKYKPITLAVRPKTPFPSGSTVTLIWGKGISSVKGVSSAKDQQIPFEVRPPLQAHFSCERENAGADCNPITAMTLTFSESIPREQAAKIVLKKGKETWPAQVSGEVDSTRYVTFKGPFPAEAAFQIVLPAAVADRDGRLLSNQKNFPLEVKTADYPPLAKFSSSFGILESKAGAVVPVSLRNLEPSVKVSVTQDVKIQGKSIRLGVDQAHQILKWIVDVERQGISGRASSLLTDEGPGVKTLSVPKPNGPKAFELVGIPLKNSGFHVLELASPRLGASLIGSSTPMYVSTAVLVTNLGVHLKWGRESSLVWVTTLDQAKPVSGAEVVVRDCGGEVHARAKSDSKGVAAFRSLPRPEVLPECPNPWDEGEGHKGLIVTAEKSGDFSLVYSDWQKGIEPWRFGLRSEYFPGPRIGRTVFDRTLFRAGEKVHMRHFLRQHQMSGFGSVPEKDRPKAVKIEHQGSGQKYVFPITWNQDGSAEMEWSIPREAKLGHYSVVMEERSMEDLSKKDTEYRWGPSWTSGTFRVEEFRVPLMKGRIIPRAEKIVAGVSESPVHLSVSYLSGGGAGDLPVKFRTQVNPGSIPDFQNFEEFTFANGAARKDEHRADPKSEKIRTTDLTLDASGAASSSLAIEDWSVPKRILAELEFTDPNGEVQTLSQDIPVYPASRLVGLKMDDWAVQKDGAKVHAAVVDLQGKPAAGVPVSIDVFERKTYSHRKKVVGGFYAYEHQTELKKLGEFCTGKTDEKGRLLCTGKSPASGQIIFQASAKDDSGRSTQAHVTAWLWDSDAWWFESADHDRMDVLPGRKRYEPGEKATFQVRLPFQKATALVTVEREGVLDTFTQEITSAKPLIEIPIKPNYAPNVFISAFVVRGRVGDPQPTALVDLGKPAYKLGFSEILVGWKAHELKVKVTPERDVYRIREKVKTTIQVRDPEGKAPAAGSEVILAAVDEGLLELKPNESWDLLGQMMNPRGQEVFTSTAQMHIVGKRHFGLKSRPPGGDGGKAPTRELFDTLLFWKGRVPLDRNGDATVEVPLNDSVTGFRLVAVATSGLQRFGTGASSIRVTQDLMILSGLSPIAREGDQFIAEVTVRNTTNRTMKTVVHAQAEGASTKLAPVPFALKAGEAKLAKWRMTVPVGQESLKYTFEAQEEGGTARDRMSVSQKVKEVHPVRVYQATLAQIEKEAKWPVQVPKDAIPGRGGVKVILQPTLVSGLEGVRAYMRRYPYNCLEQVTSKAVALRDVSLWSSVAAGLPSYLDGDGLAKYFPSMPEGSDTLTAYVLSIAHEAGWEIPESSRSRMLTGLRNFVEGKITRGSALPTADLAIRKVAAIEALSRYGQANANLLSTFIVEPELWPTSAVLDWWNILRRNFDQKDKDVKARQAEQILRSRLNFQGTMMSFSTEAMDSLWWLMISRDLNAVRMLLAVHDQVSWKEDVPRVLRGALERMKNGHWDLTTANAWGVLAVEKFGKTFEKVPVSGSSSVTSGGDKKILDWSMKQSGGDFLFPWSGKTDSLSIAHQGAGKPWATLQSLAAIPLKQPLSTGYKILSKTWTPVTQKKAGVWTRGDVVRVKLELESQADRTWVVLDDPIPAGTMILGSGLGNDSRLSTQSEKERGHSWLAYVERAMDSYRAYYEYVPKGNWTVEYTLRLNQSGEMLMPATRVEAMYSPEMFGERPNAQMKVGARE